LFSTSSIIVESTVVEIYLNLNYNYVKNYGTEGVPTTTTTLYQRFSLFLFASTFVRA
jgi:hypothetical protein